MSKKIIQAQNNIDPSLVGLKKNRSLVRPYERKWVQGLIIFFVTFCAIFSLFPLLLTVINSLKTDDQVAANVFSLPTGEMFKALASNFAAAWNEINVYFGRTMIIALIGAIFEVLISSALAYILTFKEFYFKNLIFMFYISILLVPSIIGYPVLTPLVKDTLGLRNAQVIGFLLPMIGGCQAAGMFLFKTFFSQQPKSLYECAKIEGNNDLKCYLKITLPLALPIVLYYFVGCFSGIYNEYLWASLIFDPSKTTLMTRMLSLVDSGTLVYGSMYAMYLISSVPLIITTIISMKYFKSGEFAAGLKL